jgi:glycosyltransferase involved in cell wall biosynthesis
MKIIIDCRNTYNSDAALSIFTRECWQDMALLKPADEFIFITARDQMPVQTTENVHVRELKKTNIPWLDRKRLNNHLKKWKADRFITLHETGFCMYHFQKENRQVAGMPAHCILFADNVNEQPQSAMVLQVIQPACRTVVSSLSWTEATDIRTQYTGGRSFFLFTGNISEQHQLVDLLKAFSVFKKWQQSNMQLVIAGYATAWTQEFEKKLLTYRYKADVLLIKNVTSTDMAKLAAACYAMVYPAAANIFPLALLLAVQSNKAVIASDTYINRQMIQAAEWVDKNDTAAGFAKAMILLYKDEQHQQSLVQQTIAPSAQFNRQQMLSELWQCIEK